MSLISKEMLKDAKDRIKKDHDDLKEQKEELKSLENQLKVEEKVLESLRGDKDLSPYQEGAMTAVESEIAIQKEKISETKIDIKLLSKKIEVLNKGIF